VSAMFVTAMAANALLVELARQTAGVRITWTQWAWAALAPGLVGLALVPYAVYRLCPPEVQDTDEARKIARLRIIEMGPLGRAEKLMLAVFVPVLLLWVTEGWHGRAPVARRAGRAGRVGHARLVRRDRDAGRAVE